MGDLDAPVAITKAPVQDVQALIRMHSDLNLE